MKLLRDAFAEPGPRFGGWCNLGDQLAAEQMGRAGFDWVCLDAQHSHFGGPEGLVPLLVALAGTGTPSLVRVPWKSDASAIMRVLDGGAQGVIVPMVETVEEAAYAASACRYPPRGMRSWGPFRAAYALPGYTPAVGNDATLCFIMIETVGALAAVDEILALPEVDGVYVGPMDLSLTHGGTIQPASQNPLIAELLPRVLEACERRGKIAGIHTAGPQEALGFARQGFRLINVVSDAGLLREGAAATVAALRAG